MAQRAQANEVNIPDLIDRTKVGWFQAKTVILCFLVTTIDGFNLQSPGYVAPVIIRSWHIDRSALGPVFSAGLFGLMMGGFLFGLLADRFGRKNNIIICCTLFGLATLATVTTDSLSGLIVCRFLTGLGLGGAVPNAIALIAESLPMRNRATAVGMMSCGQSVGAAIGGLLSAWLLSRFDWTSVFYAGGLLSLALIPFLIVSLPESACMLVLMKRPAAQIVALLRKFNLKQDFAPDTVFVLREETAKGFLPIHLFTERRALGTSLLWFAFFANLVGLQFLTSWLPTVIHDDGLPVSQAILITTMFQIGGTLGGIILGRLIDRFGFYSVLTLAFLFACVSVGLIGTVGPLAWLLAIIVFGAGFCIVGGQAGAYALGSAFYPTYIRSTGVGWALGVGRIGAVVGPLLGGILLSLQWPTAQLFYAAAVPGLCAAAAILLMTAAPGRLRAPAAEAAASNPTPEVLRPEA